MNVGHARTRVDLFLVIRAEMIQCVKGTFVWLFFLFISLFVCARMINQEGLRLSSDTRIMLAVVTSDNRINAAGKHLQ